MSSGGWRTALVLGGVGSGRSEFAASLLAEQPAGEPPARPVAPEPAQGLAVLARTIGEAKPDEVVLVDGLDGWLPAAGRGAKAAPEPAEVEALAAAIRRCPARLVITSPEVGLAVPGSAAARGHAEAVGAVNQAVAAAADAVALVVAGHPTWLKGGPGGAAAAAAATAAPATGATAVDPSHLPALPQPDEQAQEEATRSATAAGLGALAAVVGFAAGTQGTVSPAPWRAVRVLVLHGDHAGAAGAGAAGSAARAAALRQGAGPLAQVAGDAGAPLQLVSTAAAAPIEQGPASGDGDADEALAHGWALAGRAADEGVDLLVLASIGDGADTAAAAVAAALGGAGTEPAALLGRVRAPDGTIDDASWIARCAAVRDAVRRTKAGSRTAARAVLAELGGPDLATATGVILGAAARRTPVLLGGPVGAAAALAARGLAGAARRWCLVPDHGGHPTVVRACELLGLAPVLDLQLDLGEGVAALTALPLLRSALTIAPA